MDYAVGLNQREIKNPKEEKEKLEDKLK